MKPATRSFYAQAVQGVIEHVSTHLDEALDLDTLAATACLSPFHFHRVFRGMVGETPMELVRRLRMERAAWRLLHSESAITQIAFDAGFESHEAFTRAFRASYDTSPTGFRQRKHPRIELAAGSGVHFDPDGRIPLFTMRDSGGRHMHVEITEQPERRVGTVRHIGPYNQIPLAFERLGAIASQAGLVGRPGIEMLAIYHDDPETTPLDQLRSDAAVTIPGDIPVPDGLVEQRLPGGRYASTLHTGPYEALGDTWARFMGEWLPSSGKRIWQGVSFEKYLNTPAEVPKEQLQTLLFIPVS